MVLSRNQLEDIPRLPSSLTKLSAPSNLLTSIPDVRKCADLIELRLNSNRLTAVSESILENKRLFVVDIGRNNIATFDDVDCLGRLKSLRNFSLQGNRVCDSPDYAEKLKELLPQVRIFDGRKRTDLPHLVKSVGQATNSEAARTADDADEDGGTGRQQTPASDSPAKQASLPTSHADTPQARKKKKQADASNVTSAHGKVARASESGEAAPSASKSKQASLAAVDSELAGDTAAMPSTPTKQKKSKKPKNRPAVEDESSDVVNSEHASPLAASPVKRKTEHSKRTPVKDEVSSSKTSAQHTSPNMATSGEAEGTTEASIATPTKHNKDKKLKRQRKEDKESVGTSSATTAAAATTVPGATTAAAVDSETTMPAGSIVSAKSKKRKHDSAEATAEEPTEMSAQAMAAVNHCKKVKSPADKALQSTPSAAKTPCPGETSSPKKRSRVSQAAELVASPAKKHTATSSQSVLEEPEAVPTGKQKKRKRPDSDSVESTPLVGDAGSKNSPKKKRKASESVESTPLVSTAGSHESPKKKRKASLSTSLPDIASTPSRDGGDSSGGELDLSDLLADGHATSSAAAPVNPSASALSSTERLHRKRLDREEENAVLVTKHPHSGVKAMKMAMDKGAVARGRKSATKSIPPKAPGTGFDPTSLHAESDFGLGDASSW
ncbi:mucin-1-like [Sycon ciliatum]|uniref:mucin-1-like n=1 Tax=Sycon ciliatum TaxID=27933 RepID=UPI0031F6BF4F